MVRGAAVAALLAPSCIIVADEFWQGSESSLAFSWTIDGLGASSASCDAVDASRVRMAISQVPGEHHLFDEFDWPCSRSSVDTGTVFAAGTYYLSFELLSADGSVVAFDVDNRVVLSPGPNDLGTIPFATTGTGEVSLEWSWTIEAHGAGDIEALCSWANSGGPASTATVRLLVDTTRDAEADYYYDAECQWGAATTDPADDPADYSPGDEVRVAWQLLDSTDEILSQSAEYAALTLESGANDLGTVDFDLGDYGPLDVLVEWDTGSGYGGCGATDPAVAVMGYLLSFSTGEVADEVDIDPGMDCAAGISWLMVPYDTYVLELDGEDASGAAVWGATCIELTVDNNESNAYGCDVPRTT